MFRRNLQNKTFHNNLFICLTPNQTPPKTQFDIKQLFQSLQAEIQKTTEKHFLRTRPVFYQRLQQSLVQSLKFAKDHNDQAATHQRLMMEQCRNYYHTRSNTSQKRFYSQRENKRNKNDEKPIAEYFLQRKPKTPFVIKQMQKRNLQKKLNLLMKTCQKENIDLNHVKKKLGLFSYFSEKSNHKLQKIKLKVQQNQKN